MRIPIIVCLAIYLASSSAVAQPLYKSVNEKGEVTFSDRPPSNAVDVQEIEVQAGPSEAQRRESLERTRRMGNQANKLGVANEERALRRQESRQQAEQEAMDNAVQPYTEYNNGYAYPDRPIHPPVILPPHPGVPGRPVPLPAVPVQLPAR